MTTTAGMPMMGGMMPMMGGGMMPGMMGMGPMSCVMAKMTCTKTATGMKCEISAMDASMKDMVMACC